jgi:hypothetical protein
VDIKTIRQDWEARGTVANSGQTRAGESGRITSMENYHEKEYIVTVDQPALFRQ